jgi:hypothetical protein
MRGRVDGIQQSVALILAQQESVRAHLSSVCSHLATLARNSSPQPEADAGFQAAGSSRSLPDRRPGSVVTAHVGHVTVTPISHVTTPVDHVAAFGEGSGRQRPAFHKSISMDPPITLVGDAMKDLPPRKNSGQRPLRHACSLIRSAPLPPSLLLLLSCHLARSYLPSPRPPDSPCWLVTLPLQHGPQDSNCTEHVTSSRDQRPSHVIRSRVPGDHVPQKRHCQALLPSPRTDRPSR